MNVFTALKGSHFRFLSHSVPLWGGGGGRTTFSYRGTPPPVLYLVPCTPGFSINRMFPEYWPRVLYVLDQNLISSHLSPLTLEVVGAPQMTLQKYLSILPCLPLPSGNLQTPFPSISWCYLPISSSVFLSFLLLSLPLAELSSPCQKILRCGHTIWVSVSLPWLGDHHALKLDSGFCCEPPRSSHGLCRNCSEVSYNISSQGLGSSLYFCCQGPALTGIKEGR